MRASVPMTLIVSFAMSAFAVGVENNGKFRVNTGEREPAPIEDNVRIVPPPLGGPLKVSIKTDKYRYHVTDQVKVNFGVNRDSYVYVFSTDANGINRQIFPNYHDTDNFLRAGKSYYIPDRGYDLEVLGPRGEERLTAVAVTEKFPFLYPDYHSYTVQDPYPASREGAVAMVRLIESFRREPSSTTKQPIRPAPKENLWAVADTSFQVLDNVGEESPVYKVARYGNLDIDTYPSNARIYIDADYYGRSSQVIKRLSIGYHKVLLEKEGYIPYETNVYIKGNETKQIDVFLQQTPILVPDDGQQGCPPGNPCPPGTAPVVPQSAPQAPLAPAPRPVYQDVEKLEK